MIHGRDLFRDPEWVAQWKDLYGGPDSHATGAGGDEAGERDRRRLHGARRIEVDLTEPHPVEPPGLELVDAAEAWGLDGVWLGEIHFNPARSVQSAPIALASFVAARTRRVRVGTAVQILPLGNPLRIAEEVATVDHLSEGRFDFGIGRSGSPRAYDSLGIPYAESQGRFQEALEIILEAWKGEAFSYQGKFYRFENATVSPRPCQLPHPP